MIAFTDFWRDRPGLWQVLALAFVLRLAAGVLLPSIYFPDEIQQAVEPAYRALTGAGMRTWEWERGARSWILPSIMAGAMQPVLTIFGPGRAVQIAMVLACSLLSLFGIAGAYGLGKRFSPLHAICAAVAVATWHELVFFGIRPLSECVALNFVLAALYFCDRPSKVSDYVLAGFFLALTAAFRLQLAPGLAVAGLWALWRGGDWRRGVLFIGLGAVPPIALAGGVDWLTWGRPFHSYITNFTFNVVEDGAATYGVQSPVWYVREMLSRFGGFGPVLFALALLGARKTALPLLAGLAIIAVHSLIDHKEYRFIVPAIACFTALAGLGLAEAIGFAAQALKAVPRRALVAGGVGLWAACSLTGAAASQVQTHNWTDGGAVYRAVWAAGEVKGLCGLGLGGVDHRWTPGSSAFPPVPIYEEGETTTLAQAYNVWIGKSATATNPLTYTDMNFGPRPPAGFVEQTCFDAPGHRACVYVRPGGCAPALERAVNQYP